MADLERNIVLKPEMVLRLGSLTKQFTATAIMLLWDEGKLAVADDITKFLPSARP
ncbi:MAG: serine hydrolase [Pseudomonadota bacterium]|nr:serine hydrolase [Pseudomonadota bacterium]